MSGGNGVRRTLGKGYYIGLVKKVYLRGIFEGDEGLYEICLKVIEICDYSGKGQTRTGGRSELRTLGRRVSDSTRRQPKTHTL